MRGFVIFVSSLILGLTMSVAYASEVHDARSFDPAAVQRLIDEHKGQPVIVHFWGLTCGNCMAELKDWGAFARAHPKAMIILVNWDTRGGRPAQMGAALEKSGLGSAPSFALGEGYEEKLRFAVDHDWMGELPYTRLISPDGATTSFSGAADFAKLQSWAAE